MKKNSSFLGLLADLSVRSPLSQSGAERSLISSVLCFHFGDESLEHYLRHVDVSEVISSVFPDIDTRPSVSDVSNREDMLRFCREANAADGGRTAVILTTLSGAVFLAKRFPRIGYRLSDSRAAGMTEDLEKVQANTLSDKSAEGSAIQSSLTEAVNNSSVCTYSTFPNTLQSARYLLRQRPLQILIVPSFKECVEQECVKDGFTDGDHIGKVVNDEQETVFQLDPSFIHYIQLGKLGLTNAIFRLLIDTAAMQERVRLLNVLMQNEEIICNFNEELSRQTAALSYANARLSEMAMTDPLTGKYNRRYFKRRYGLEVERSHRAGLPLSVLMIDIDYFKRYNDVNGHVAGDAVLRQVADLIGQERRVNDVIARYGGEEFVVLLPDTPKWAAIQLAERMRSRVFSASFSDGDTDRSQIVSVSIGVATCPDDTIVADELIQIADKGLYEAKRLGRNRVEPGRAINAVRSHESVIDMTAPSWNQVSNTSRFQVTEID